MNADVLILDPGCNWAYIISKIIEKMLEKLPCPRNLQFEQVVREEVSYILSFMFRISRTEEECLLSFENLLQECVIFKKFLAQGTPKFIKG